MIYVSSSCVKAQTIAEAVEKLVKGGFKNIELSGGTQYYSDFEKDLLELKIKYSLNYLCHNYFPPPKDEFVLNLASLNNDIFQKTLSHLEKLIRLSSRLGAKKLGFHAGFFLDIQVGELGKLITSEAIQNEQDSIERFCEGYEILQAVAQGYGVELYIENNVFSLQNAQKYSFQNIFMLTCFQEYLSLKEKIDFKPLVDLAHLKVSANVLQKDFLKQSASFLKETDYIHISDNDGKADLNRELIEDSDIYRALKQVPLSKETTLTLEIYQPLEKIRDSYALIERLCNA